MLDTLHIKILFWNKLNIWSLNLALRNLVSKAKIYSLLEIKRMRINDYEVEI